jgi:hypothetical protein
MSAGSTPIKPNRRNRLGVFCVLPLLLFGLLAADFGPHLFAQRPQTPEELEAARRRRILRQRELAKQRELLANPNRNVSPELRKIPEPLPEDRPKWLAQAYEASKSILIESEIILESVRRWETGEISKKEIKRVLKDSNRRLKQQVKLLRRNQFLQWIDWSGETGPTQRTPLPDGSPSELAAALGTSCQRYHERISGLMQNEAATVQVNDLREQGLIESASQLQELSAKIAKKTRK